MSRNRDFFAKPIRSDRLLQDYGHTRLHRDTPDAPKLYYALLGLLPVVAWVGGMWS